MKDNSMRTMGTMAGLVLGCFGLVGNASAHTRSLYGIADDYRDAVSDFEDHARQLPQIDPFASRVIDDLEDAAGDLRSSARRPSDLGRLLADFNNVQILQQRVESTVFASRCPIIAAQLGPCWNEVLIRFSVLQSQLQGVPGCNVGAAPVADFGYPASGYPSARFPVADPRYDGRISSPLPPHTTRTHGRGHADVPFGYPAHHNVAPLPNVPPTRGDLGAAVLSSILHSVMQRHNR